jgi:hypothetical protein
MRRSSGWMRKWVWVRMGVRGSQRRGGGRGGGSQHDWGRSEGDALWKAGIPSIRLLGEKGRLMI